MAADTEKEARNMEDKALVYLEDTETGRTIPTRPISPLMVPEEKLTVMVRIF